METSLAEDRLSLLAEHALFAGLPPAEILAAAAHVLAIEADEGETLFRLGDPGDRMYVLLAGRVRLTLPSRNGGDEVIAEVAPPEWFGEMALLTGEARSATARTIERSTLLAFPRAAFRDLARRVPELAFRLSETLSRRLRGRLLRDLPEAPPRVLVLVDPGEVADGAATAERVALALARETGRSVALVDLLARSPTVGTAEIARPPPPADWPGLLDGAPERRLVLRAPRGHPWIGALVDAGAARALDDVLVSSSRAHDDAAPIVSGDATQIVRRFLRRRTALVLGAGGARGFAHIGVLRALERGGLRVDLVVGTSMGAIVGGLLALGWGSKRIEDGLREIAQHFRRRVLDIGLPGASIFRGEKKRALLEHETGGRSIESLLVPFAAVAADLTRAREHVIDRGSLAVALDATSAIPTIFPPVAVGELRLVDGWVTNPLPVDVARRLGAERVIAVDPCTEREVAPSCLPERRRLFDAGAIIRTAMRAMDIGARERAAALRTEADVCILPRLDLVASTDVQRFEEIVAAGEEAATEALPEIRRALAAP